MVEIWYLLILWTGAVVPMDNFGACAEKAVEISSIMSTEVSCISPRQNEPSTTFIDGVMGPVPGMK